jgi:hypothetical protein
VVTVNSVPKVLPDMETFCEGAKPQFYQRGRRPESQNPHPVAACMVRNADAACRCTTLIQLADVTCRSSTPFPTPASIGMPVSRCDRPAPCR